jgi:hypothetical protein
MPLGLDETRCTKTSNGRRAWVRADLEHGRLAVAGVVAEGPEQLQLSVELERHNTGEAADDRRNVGVAAVRVFQREGVNLAVRFDADEEEPPA